MGIATGNGPSSAAAIGASNGAGGAGIGGVGGSDGLSPQDPRAFALRAVYFRRDAYSSTADCLTAAHAQRLPLDLCQ